MKKLKRASLVILWTAFVTWAAWNNGAHTEHNRLLWVALTSDEPLVPIIDNDERVHTYRRLRWGFAWPTDGSKAGLTSEQEPRVAGQ